MPFWVLYGATIELGCSYLLNSTISPNHRLPGTDNISARLVQLYLNKKPNIETQVRLIMFAMIFVGNPISHSCMCEVRVGHLYIPHYLDFHSNGTCTGGTTTLVNAGGKIQQNSTVAQLWVLNLRNVGS